MLGCFDCQPCVCRVTCASLSRFPKRSSRACDALGCDRSHRGTGYVCLLLLSSFIFIALLWCPYLSLAQLFLIFLLQPTVTLHVKNTEPETMWIPDTDIRLFDRCVQWEQRWQAYRLQRQ